MAQKTKNTTLHGSDQQLREEVEHLRQRLSELESSLDESQRTIAALQKRERLYRTILENIPPVTYVIGVGNESLNSPIYSSPQIEKILGHASEEFLKDPLLWLDMIYPEDRDHAMAASEHADLTGGPFDAEYRVVSGDKGISWFHDESVLVKDDHGQPLYRVGILTDVTERKQAELARQHAEDLYQRAIIAAGAVPYVLDHSTQALTFIGEGILAMTGYSASEMMQTNMWNALVQEGFPRGSLAHLTYEEADRLTNENNSIPWECDYRIVTRDGQLRWIADTSVKGFDKESGHILSIGIKQDITERKLAEGMREKLIGELEQRNAELERIAYTLSHELKSPLITIRGFLGYLRDDALSGNIPRLERDIHRITEGADKMLRLLNELIDLMSVGRVSFSPEKIHLQGLVGEAVELVREKLDQKNIAVHVAGDLPTVHGDRKHLLEVFQNLLENSVKYMGKPTEPKIEIGQVVRQDSTPIFYVRDNGIGIDPRFTERIFRIFEKLDVRSEGTGIGLALVKRIIEVHGGKIWVESDGLGKGAMFCFTLPDHPKPTEPKWT